jgi:hypothetical protein
MALVMCVNANAQTEWMVEYVPVDELTGDGGNYINIYYDEECFFGFRSDLDMVTISTFKGMFDYEDGRISVLIGYYKDGVLIEKETKYFSRVTSDMANCKGKSKIVNHLKNIGDIRIVVERYNRSNFDLTIPKNPKLR